MDTLFPFLVGRAPQDGEWVRILDAATQSYQTTTFHAGTGWDNVDPALSVGQSAWVYLVPEPGVFGLYAVGAAALLWFRKGKQAGPAA
jgi:hypothetical protein